MSLYIEVDIFGGTPIENACQDLMALAGRLQITVKAKFNGVALMAFHDEGDADALAENWREACAKPDWQYKIATSRPRAAVSP